MSLLSEGNRSHLDISVRLVVTTSALFIATYQTADSCSYDQNVECHSERVLSLSRCWMWMILEGRRMLPTQVVTTFFDHGLWISTRSGLGLKIMPYGTNQAWSLDNNTKWRCCTNFLHREVVDPTRENGGDSGVVGSINCRTPHNRRIITPHGTHQEYMC
jgi:hypothetical protein